MSRWTYATVSGRAPVRFSRNALGGVPECSVEHFDRRVEGVADTAFRNDELRLRRIRFDTWIGMSFSNIVALCIMATAAATLHANGITTITTAEQAASALRPIAGDFAFRKARGTHSATPISPAVRSRFSSWVNCRSKQGSSARTD